VSLREVGASHPVEEILSESGEALTRFAQLTDLA